MPCGEDRLDNNNFFKTLPEISMQGPRVLYSFINNFCKTNFQPHGIDTIQLTNIPIDTFPGGDMNNSWGNRSFLEIFFKILTTYGPHFWEAGT